jgi:hypothetical protein
MTLTIDAPAVFKTLDERLLSHNHTSGSQCRWRLLGVTARGSTLMNKSGYDLSWHP